MEDPAILALYEKRDEGAVDETARKYGAYCRRIAESLLDPEDAEECLNDAWLAAWQRIPPEQPRSLQIWLGKVTRNLSISRWRALHARKRDAGTPLLLSELEDCIPGGTSPEASLEAAELTELLNRWLRSLPPEDRAIFLRRYWQGEPLNRIAEALDCKPARLAQRMLTLRRALRTVLEKEGVLL